MTAPGHPGSVLTINEALVDVVIHPGQEPADIPGGTPANVVLGLTRLGRDVELHCWINTDERDQAVRSRLQAFGVCLAPGADGAARTSTAQATIGEDRTANYVFDLDQNPPRPTLPDGQAPLLMYTDSIAAILASGAATMEQVLRETRTTSTIAYDPNAHPQLMGDPKNARRIIERLVDLSGLVKCSDEDIAWPYGQDAGLETVLRSWLGKGAVAMMVTRDKEEALALSVSRVRLEVPADPSVVVADTMGAGNPFVGGLEDTLWSEGLVSADRREVLCAVDAETLEWIICHTAATADVTVSRARANPPTRDKLS